MACGVKVGLAWLIPMCVEEGRSGGTGCAGEARAPKAHRRSFASARCRLRQRGFAPSLLLLPKSGRGTDPVPSPLLLLLPCKRHPALSPGLHILPHSDRSRGYGRSPTARKRAVTASALRRQSAPSAPGLRPACPSVMQKAEVRFQRSDSHLPPSAPIKVRQVHPTPCPVFCPRQPPIEAQCPSLDGCSPYLMTRTHAYSIRSPSQSVCGLTEAFQSYSNIHNHPRHQRKYHGKREIKQKPLHSQLNLQQAEVCDFCRGLSHECRVAEGHSLRNLSHSPIVRFLYLFPLLTTTSRLLRRRPFRGILFAKGWLKMTHLQDFCCIIARLRRKNGLPTTAAA